MHRFGEDTLLVLLWVLLKLLTVPLTSNLHILLKKVRRIQPKYRADKGTSTSYELNLQFLISNIPLICHVDLWLNILTDICTESVKVFEEHLHRIKEKRSDLKFKSKGNPKKALCLQKGILKQPLVSYSLSCRRWGSALQVGFALRW